MSSTPHLRGGMPRAPLQPRETPLDQNGTKCSTSAEAASVSTNGNLHCKRLNPECVTNSASENEPLNSVFVKRQRTKSGSEPMEPSNDNWNSNVNLCSLKSDGVVQRGGGYRVSKPESNNAKEQTTLGHVVRDTKDSNAENENVYSNFSTNKNNRSGGYLNNNVNNRTSLENDNIESANENKEIPPIGGMSPNCAATLEYVTQLPEGCSSSANSSCTIMASAVGDARGPQDSDDDDLEDDDNYLDSSEPEDNDLDHGSLSNNDDEESCCEDDESVISSVTVGSTSSLWSVASETVSSICMNEHGVAANEDGSLLYNHTPAATPLVPLMPSLFSHVPPTINFCKYNETTTKFTEDISKLLKWRFTSITPLIVKKTVTNSGFRISKKNSLWCGMWGKHMKSQFFKGIKDYQKVNHFPATFQIGRKDKLWKNFAKLQAKFGKEHFGFIPKTFVLPGDMKSLKAAFDKEGVKKKWIVKPPASARGTGIQVINKWSQIPTDTPVVVQRYISMPFLINNTKFDIRIYVLVTSFHPLRIFLYEDGLVRFASVQYQKTSKSLSDRFMHLTNYSVNKSSTSYTHNDDAGHCLGHKWTLKTLWGYLKAQDVDTAALWNRIADLVIKTIISGENDIVLRTRKCARSMYSCFEVFGFDVILDEKLRPWLLEVNISPSLHSASSLDHSVKGPLISDLLNLVGYHIPDKLTEEKQVELLKSFNLGEKVTGLCLDRRIYTRLITPEEQVKHVKMNSLPRTQYLTDILENLHPDDIRHLLISEDQRHKAGKFTCIFPTADTHNYFVFLDKTRYYNRLMDAWETVYGNSREKGIELLDNLCKDKHHLKVTPRFKMPKVVGSGDLNRSVRQPVSPQQTNLSPCSPPPGAPTETVSQERATAENLPTSVATQVERLQKQKIRLCHKKVPKVVVHPLKPAIVTNFLNMQAVASGKKTSKVMPKPDAVDDEYEDIDDYR